MVLIDTHALIWALYDPEQLSEAAVAAISKGDCCISVVSLWEMSIKAAKGQLILKDSIVDIAGRCTKMGVDILSISPEHCQRLQSLPAYHKDPFDRMLIAQAIVEGFPLVTKDDNIWKGYDDLEKIW
ncbi:MAG: type II toxin-antitoxin system VapC family toxin [Clostridia bacterium]|nr:type II toxin-antitoxin system VapC family toxin [Clostridia bacterium]